MSQTETNTFLGLILLQLLGCGPQTMGGSRPRGKVPLYPDASGAHACLCFPRAVLRTSTAWPLSQEGIDDPGPVDCIQSSVSAYLTGHSSAFIPGHSPEEQKSVLCI